MAKADLGAGKAKARFRLHCGHPGLENAAL